MPMNAAIAALFTCSPIHHPWKSSCIHCISIFPQKHPPPFLSFYVSFPLLLCIDRFRIFQSSKGVPLCRIFAGEIKWIWLESHMVLNEVLYPVGVNHRRFSLPRFTVYQLHGSALSRYFLTFTSGQLEPSHVLRQFLISLHFTMGRTCILFADISLPSLCSNAVTTQ